MTRSEPLKPMRDNAVTHRYRLVRMSQIAAETVEEIDGIARVSEAVSRNPDSRTVRLLRGRFFGRR